MSAKSKKLDKQIRSFPLTRENLAKLKHKAMRRGLWFRELKQKERMLLDLTVRVVEKVQSFLLAKILSQIVGKLCEAMESRIVRLIRTEGKEMTKRLSELVQSWGYRAAKAWASDVGFMQYLVVNRLGEFGG